MWNVLWLYWDQKQKTKRLRQPKINARAKREYFGKDVLLCITFFVWRACKGTSIQIVFHENRMRFECGVLWCVVSMCSHDDDDVNIGKFGACVVAGCPLWNKENHTPVTGRYTFKKEIRIFWGKSAKNCEDIAMVSRGYSEGWSSSFHLFAGFTMNFVHSVVIVTKLSFREAYIIFFYSTFWRPWTWKSIQIFM